MEKNKYENEVRKDPSETPEAATAGKQEAPVAEHHDEEHAHGNYMFALKVLCILLAIIAVIVILKASGVPIAIKDWLAKSGRLLYARPFPLLF